MLKNVRVFDYDPYVGDADRERIRAVVGTLVGYKSSPCCGSVEHEGVPHVGEEVVMHPRSGDVVRKQNRGTAVGIIVGIAVVIGLGVAINAATKDSGFDIRFGGY